MNTLTIPDEQSLAPHRVFAIWCEDGTEVLDWFLDETEARRELERLRQNGEPSEVFHLAAYEMAESSAIECPPDEYDPWDYDPEDLM